MSLSPPVLESPQVRLRPLAGTDVDGLYALYSDAQVTRHWSFPAWTQRAQAEDYLALRRSLLPPSVYCWAIAEGDDDRLIGTITLFVLGDTTRYGEIGYALRLDRQGRGLASESLRLAIRHAFDTLGLGRIEADVDPSNEASWRLLERLGFHREAVLQGRCRRGDEIGDAAIYALQRTDWSANR